MQSKTMTCFRLILILTLALAGSAAYGDEQAVAQAYDEFRALLDEEDYENAIPAGREVLRLAERTFGADADVLIRPVIDLAGAFRSAGLYGTAETYYERGIALIEHAEGVYSPRLIDPLVGPPFDNEARSNAAPGICSFDYKMRRGKRGKQYRFLQIPFD